MKLPLQSVGGITVYNDRYPRQFCKYSKLHSDGMTHRISFQMYLILFTISSYQQLQFATRI